MIYFAIGFVAMIGILLVYLSNNVMTFVLGCILTLGALVTPIFIHTEEQSAICAAKGGMRIKAEGRIICAAVTELK
jgi:hypothetical protein